MDPKDINVYEMSNDQLIEVGLSLKETVDAGCDYEQVDGLMQGTSRDLSCVSADIYAPLTSRELISQIGKVFNSKQGVGQEPRAYWADFSSLVLSG